MDGAELAQRLRGLLAGRPDLRLIALTGFGGAEVQRKLLEAGFDLHLVKPAHPDILLRAVGIRDSSGVMLS
jgi:CheY-like chemotaxis protein